MTQSLYLQDSYVQTLDAHITSNTPEGVILDKTIFYPTGGGQPFDTGVLTDSQGKQYRVFNVTKTEQGILHHISGEMPEQGCTVHGFIDWTRRYRLMRMHTAAHLLSGIIHEKTGAVITGNQLGLDESRVDFDLETFDKDQILSFAIAANAIIVEKKSVQISFGSPKEAKKLCKLSTGNYDHLSEVRMITIEGTDAQPCGGTHIKNTEEISTITITQVKNKGKNNRRLYFTIP